MAKQAPRKRTTKRQTAKKPQRQTDEPKRRMRYGPLPVPDERADLYWGVSQPELCDLTDGKLAAELMASPEFEHVLGPKLDEIDRRNRTGHGTSLGRPTCWTARQVEAVLVYRRVAGTSTVKRARERLFFDREGRKQLGLSDHLPSAPTITPYLGQHFDPEERVGLYRELDRRLRKRVMELPGFDEEARKMGLDGSQHGTHYTPPIPEVDENGEATDVIKNADIPKGQRGAITAPDAGIVGKGGGPKAGQGWQFVGLFSEHGTLLSWDISALQKSEHPAAERILDDYEAQVLPHRGLQTLSVCAADGGFRIESFAPACPTETLSAWPVSAVATTGRGSERTLPLVRRDSKPAPTQALTRDMTRGIIGTYS